MPRIPSAVAEAEQPAALYSELINRRVTLRYPCGPVTVTSIARKSRPRFTKARVHDISQGGIALILRRPPQVGEDVYLQLTNRILDFSFDLVAEVRHVERRPRVGWIVGLEFCEPLSLAELAALL
jgi:hypothetical protein